MDDMKNLYLTIGERIRENRIEKNLKQSDLAERVEINRTSISNIEKGRHQPPLHLIYKISEALEIDIQKLLPALDELRYDSLVNEESSVYELIRESKNISEKTKIKIENLFDRLD